MISVSLTRLYEVCGTLNQSPQKVQKVILNGDYFRAFVFQAKSRKYSFHDKTWGQKNTF